MKFNKIKNYKFVMKYNLKKYAHNIMKKYNIT